jgi:hypothetical protein
MRGFAGGGSDASAGAAGGGNPPGGGAFSGGFSSIDGSDGLIAMWGLSFNNGGVAAGVPAAEGAGNGAAGATGGGGGAGTGDVEVTGGTPSGDLSRRSFSFGRGSG